MYFRLPNVFVANYIDTAESDSDAEKPKFQIPPELLNEPQDFEAKVLFAQNVIRWALEMCPGGVVMSTSFGMQSAIMLHLISQIDKTIPVIWIDTGAVHCYYVTVV
jgi:3'-phosphoadenosine 5'-phosphosulfate sulfotransferase (PAPS reductase)/FAD synthetase